MKQFPENINELSKFIDHLVQQLKGFRKDCQDGSKCRISIDRFDRLVQGLGVENDDMKTEEEKTILELVDTLNLARKEYENVSRVT